MLVCVALFSANQLLYYMSNNKAAPFTFHLITVGLSTLLTAVYLYFNYPLDKHKTAIKLVITKYWKHATLICATFGGMDIMAFAFALKYVGITTTTIISQLWVIFTVIGLHVYKKNRKTHNHIGMKQWALITLAFFGAALAIASQAPANNTSLMAAVAGSLSVTLLAPLVVALLSMLTVVATIIGGDIITQENNKNQTNKATPITSTSPCSFSPSKTSTHYRLPLLARCLRMKPQTT